MDDDKTEIIIFREYKLDAKGNNYITKLNDYDVSILLKNLKSTGIKVNKKSSDKTISYFCKDSKGKLEEKLAHMPIMTEFPYSKYEIINMELTDCEGLELTISNYKYIRKSKKVPEKTIEVHNGIICSFYKVNNKECSEEFIVGITKALNKTYFIERNFSENEHQDTSHKYLDTKEGSNALKKAIKKIQKEKKEKSSSGFENKTDPFSKNDDFFSK